MDNYDFINKINNTSRDHNQFNTFNYNFGQDYEVQEEMHSNFDSGKNKKIETPSINPNNDSSIVNFKLESEEQQQTEQSPIQDNMNSQSLIKEQLKIHQRSKGRNKSKQQQLFGITERTEQYSSEKQQSLNVIYGKIQSYQPFNERINASNLLQQDSCDIVSYHYEEKDARNAYNDAADVDNNSPRHRENSNNRKNIMVGMNFAEKMKLQQSNDHFKKDESSIQKISFNEVQTDLSQYFKDLKESQRQATEQEGENHDESLEELVTNSDDEKIRQKEDQKFDNLKYIFSQLKGKTDPFQMINDYNSEEKDVNFAFKHSRGNSIGQISPGFYTFSGLRLGQEEQLKILQISPSEQNSNNTPAYKFDELIDARSPIKPQDMSSQIISPQTAEQIQNMFNGYKAQNQIQPISDFYSQEFQYNSNEYMRAKVLIDAIFDLELKREMLLKIHSQNKLQIDMNVYYEVDYLTDQAIMDFIQLLDKSNDHRPQLTLADLVKASISIKLNSDLDKNLGGYPIKQLIHKKLQFLILIVSEFRQLKEQNNEHYKSQHKYASSQLKKIKKFCEKYRQKSPMLLKKYSSIKSIGQLKESPSKLFTMRNQKKIKVNQSDQAIDNNFSLMNQVNQYKNSFPISQSESQNKFSNSTQEQTTQNTQSDEKLVKLVSDFSQSNLSGSNMSIKKQDLSNTQPIKRSIRNQTYMPYGGSGLISENTSQKQFKGLIKQFSKGKINANGSLKQKIQSEKLIKQIIRNN
ncbi:UNKNOWN [Stylonychia lemnae]|uniref:Uncharacterized protein n=1 Tax=Stylonychia lemnae TaxID=5949 RepID=A0A078ADP9_STYLE|nr:UNKNOWN [Stylonychia lemnae]|eukprot:CDW79961.1 UNKNOWN [Stylonychia lemnae]